LQDGAVSDDGRVAATVADEIKVWDLEAKLLIRTISLDGPSPWALAVSPTGRFVSLTVTHQACVWDVATGEKLGCPLGGLPAPPFSTITSPC
jgi:WD40 repeat protein